MVFYLKNKHGMAESVRADTLFKNSAGIPTHVAGGSVKGAESLHAVQVH